MDNGANKAGNEKWNKKEEEEEVQNENKPEAGSYLKQFVAA